ncbi:SsrA-binding protein SmpB [Candidatus Gracilibacteria bacterium]|nr:SsrA-binding protein SmpB [Candidatus Gracilibacteria bacterium]
MIEIVRNKKAYFDYEILSSYEAGIELLGHEVKSIRAKQVNLKGSYISMQSGRPVMKSAHISAYKILPNKDAIPVDRDRKLFLHKKDIEYLKEKSKAGGFTIIPLRLYYKGNLIKLEVGLAKGRQKHQKKQVLKERTMEREAKVRMNNYL